MRYSILILFLSARFGNAGVLASHAECKDSCASAIASNDNEPTRSSLSIDCDMFLATTLYPTMRYIIFLPLKLPVATWTQSADNTSLYIASSPPPLLQ